MYVVCDRCRAAVGVGCEEVEERGALRSADALVLCLWLNVEPVRLKCVLCARCAAARVVVWLL